MALDGMRALQLLLDHIQRTTHSSMVGLEILPPRIAVSGVNFVEFAAGGTDMASFGGTLRSLGFIHVAQHKSKEVSLWQQDELKLLVNSDADSFAHSAFVMHGTSVCDIGLLVDDADSAVNRAHRLGANVFAHKSGMGELGIPAVRGVGGSLIHFVDRSLIASDLWQTEFIGLCPTGKGAGLTKVDHIGQVVGLGDLVTWSLFYQSLFNVEKTATVDVVDSGGIVRSLALYSPDGSFRITLNGVDTRKTVAGRFMATSSGTPVQHVAFATDDIFATAEALSERGFECLSVAEEYYIDIAAEFGLELSFIERLKACNLFYDENESGTYFQLYSRSFGSGLFFEVVQREGGYSGYGGANAPYRTAMQKRERSK
jgi:4-hydroxyphenylpyruvate dioxygenase